MSTTPQDEFLGYVVEPEDSRRKEKEDERRVRVGFLADLMTLAEAERGINLEGLVRQLEAHCIKIALERHSGDLTRAALWLGYRTPAALQFVMRRHPKIKA
jgi:hypothetical protein